MPLSIIGERKTRPTLTQQFYIFTLNKNNLLFPTSTSDVSQQKTLFSLDDTLHGTIYKKSV